MKRIATLILLLFLAIILLANPTPIPEETKPAPTFFPLVRNTLFSDDEGEDEGRPPFERVYFPIMTYYSRLGERRIGMAYAAYSSRRLPRDMSILHVEWFHKWTTCDSRTEGHAGYVYNFACYYAFDNADCIPEDYPGLIMFLNEPDLESQCTMEPTEGVAFYKRVREDYPEAQIVGPALSHLDCWENNCDWLREFYYILAQENYPFPDYVDVHDYLNQSPELLLDRYRQLLIGFGVVPKFRIGEFGRFNPDLAYQAIKYYDSECSDCEAYAWFAPRYGIPLLDPTAQTYNWTRTGEAWDRYFNP